MSNLKTVASIQGAGTYESPHGLLYKFDYTFEDETTIGANHKTTTPPFKVGDEVEVIVRGTNGNFTWGQVKRPENLQFNNSSSKAKPTNKDETTRRIEASWAINAAISSLGILKGDKDTYLNTVEAMGRELLLRRDSIVKTPYNEPVASSSTRWSDEDMNRAESVAEVELPEPSANDLPF